MMYQVLIALALIVGAKCDPNNNEIEQCNLPDELIKEIAAYAPTVNKIIDAAVNGSFKGKTYDELNTFVNIFGSRLAGSQNLENAIDYMLNKSVEADLENVHGENVQVPHWVRGQESATMVEPRNKSLTMLGLGNSIGTPPEGILAEVLVVKSFDDLTANADKAKGKIVVYNENFTTYGASAQYRGYGATEAAKVGAVASLIRSVTPFSLNTPHTGMQSYGDNVTKIPTACITVEDAHLLQRLQDTGDTIKILLKMEAQNLPAVTSRNTVAELRGSQEAKKVVVVSGHLDSWDVGEGAMDDGGGVFISWGALALLKSLDLRPKRTIRAILWTGEEFGYVGAKGYVKAHANESDNLIFAMESDIGTFNPVGIEVAAGEQGVCILEEVMKLLAPINATRVRVSDSGVGSDIELWTEGDIPGASLDTENERYFWFHHSPADTMDVEDPVALDKNTALWASVAYVIADMSVDFPRKSEKIK